MIPSWMRTIDTKGGATIRGSESRVKRDYPEREMIAIKKSAMARNCRTEATSVHIPGRTDSEHLADRLASRQLHRLARLIGHLGAVVDAEAVIHGGAQIGRRADAAAHRIGAVAVGLAEDDAELDAAAGQQHGVAVVPVIAAGVLVDL